MFTLAGNAPGEKQPNGFILSFMRENFYDFHLENAVAPVSDASTKLRTCAPSIA